jgi:hypothetical protein
MTDAEADEWFKANAAYQVSNQVGLTIYRLARNGGPPDERVEAAIAENAPRPEPVHVQRFLVQWFVGTFGRER